jgi:hypothetical protein
LTERKETLPVLAERYPRDDLARFLLPQGQYHPFPTARERQAWETLPREVCDTYLQAAEKLLYHEWPSLPATLFMQFRRMGNRSRYEGPHFERRRDLANLVMAECIENKGRFLDDIINGLWAVCEESFWGVPAHNNSQRFPGSPLPDTSERIIDLFAAETGGLMAWTYYLLSSQLEMEAPVVCDRLRREVNERILEPYLSRDDFWWMGLSESSRRSVNNWCPWCNSNCLTAALVLETDFDRRVAVVTKALRSLDSFLSVYHSDGGCDEGTSYWDRAGGSLFDCLELLHDATAGHIDVYAEPLIAHLGRFLYRSYVGGGNWFLNFADGSAKVGISAEMVFRYGRRIGDDNLMALGSAAFHRRTTEEKALIGAFTLGRKLPAAFNYSQILTASPEPPFVRDVWMDGIEVFAAREQEGSDKGLYLAGKGGHNAESHNHNDVGQFILFCDGRPIFIDAGVEQYTAKTFSSRRYELWTMQSAYHNLPTIGGVQQAPGGNFRARDPRHECTDDHACLSLDIAGAYPEEAGVQTWQRTLCLQRSSSAAVEITDDFRLTKPVEVTLSLLTPCEPDVSQPGMIVLPDGRTVTLQYPVEALTPTVERLELQDPRMVPVWGDHLYRLVLASREAIAQGKWVLRVTAE